MRYQHETQVSDNTLITRLRFVLVTLSIALAVKIALRPENHTVFPIFATGSMHWWADVSLYEDYAPLDYYRYPPLFAILFSPFAVLGSTLGGILWSWFSLGLFCLGLHRFERDVLADQFTSIARISFYLLALFGALRGFWNAQANAVIVALILFGASAIRREKWWLASLFLCLSVSLKLTPIPLLLLLCALWPRQLIGRSLLLLFLSFLIPFLTRPPGIVWQQYVAWGTQMQSLAHERWPGFRDGWTVFIVFEHLWQFGSGLPDLKAPLDSMIYSVIQLVTGGLTLLWCLRLKRNCSNSQTVLMGTLAMGTCWLMLFGPATEHPTYVFLAPFLAWALTLRNTSYRWLLILSGVFILVLGWRAVTASFWNVAPWLILTLPVGTLCFTIWLMVSDWTSQVPEECPHGSSQLPEPLTQK